MSGHSHWATIKHKKQASDAKRGKAFSKISKLMMVAVREGGANPEFNLRLQFALEKARECGMPKENIDRLLKKTESIALESITYEGYGPGGAAILVEALSDNRNRTASEMRHIFENHNGSLGGANSVAWMFERKGIFAIDGKAATEDEMISAALDCGAENVVLQGDLFEVTCAPTDYAKVKAALSKKYALKSTELALLPKNTVDADEAMGRKLITLLEALEDHDDVQNVTINANLPQTLMTEKA